MTPGKSRTPVRRALVRQMVGLYVTHDRATCEQDGVAE
jgi:hypothetical protein